MARTAKAKPVPDLAQEEKEVPELGQETKPTPDTEVKTRELPKVGNPENTVVIGGQLIEIKPMK